MEAGGVPGDAASVRQALRQALRQAKFDSVRETFVLGPNQIPTEDYCSVQVVADPQGAWTLASRERVIEKALDPYAAECKMAASN